MNKKSIEEVLMFRSQSQTLEVKIYFSFRLNTLIEY